MEVENDCTDISVGQHVEVTVKTVPLYCGIMWTGAYEAPGENMRMSTYTPSLEREGLLMLRLLFAE